MNKDFNDWYLEICIEPKEGQITNRSKAITNYIKSVKRDDIINLAKLFYGLTEDVSIVDNFIQEIIKIDDTFSRKNTREIALLAGAVLDEMACTNNPYFGFIELLIIAMRFGGREPVLNEVYNSIYNEFCKDSINIRESKDFSKVKKLGKIQEKDILENGTLISEAPKRIFNSLNNIIDNINLINQKQDEIENKLNVYQEDSQFLWWITTGWSEELDCQFKKIEKKKACLIIGKRAAEFVNVFPGPYSIKGVFQTILSLCKGNEIELDIDSIIYLIEDSWKKEYINKYNLNNLSSILPINSAIIRANNTNSKDEWYSKYIIEMKLNENVLKTFPLEFSMQIYFETLVYNCYHSIEGV